MKRSTSYLVAFLTGAVISIMVTANTEFGRITSSSVSLIINQIVGIVSLQIIMTLGRKNRVINPHRSAVKWYNEAFGGFFGVAIISLNYISVVGTGATVSMAGAVFGQSAAGLFFDLSGALGMEKIRISRRRWLSLGLCALGILIYFLSPGDLNFYVFPSILAGILTMVQMVYNSRLASCKGAFYSARQNVITGLIGALLYSFIFQREETVAGFRSISESPLYLMLLGGLLACIVVVNTNVIIPKIPAVYSALLLSSGQILMALLVDYLLYSIFNFTLLLGTLVMIAGIILSLETKK